MREFQSEHETTASTHSEVPLGFVPVTCVTRLFAGAPFAAGWAASVVVPLVRAVESDVPHAMFVGAMFVATLAPALLYLRRHAMQATLRWDHEAITLLRGGRVATAIAWRDARVRLRVDRSGARLVQIADADGRSLTLATGSPTGLVAPLGRARIASRSLDDVLRIARERATFERGAPRIDPHGRTSRALLVWLLACLGVALVASEQRHLEPVAAFAFACACVALLIDPARRVAAAFHRPVGRETAEARGTPYRSPQAPVRATFVETRDDRVLRFEHLRAALVDVIGYGAFFATAVAAALVAS